jgi:hypothetical protein
MALQLVRPPKQESPERWQKAFQRAIEQGLEVFVVNDTGERLVTSATRLDIVHRTDGYTCTCEAAVLGADPVCQHRAVVRSLFGWLTDPTPAAPTPAQAHPNAWGQHSIAA